ncbi:MAG: hypothetical protein OR998_01155 [Flavobacteriaceae bacterium]|nr:hypothetical protein [Flavobacteriaceae bacterium]
MKKTILIPILILAFSFSANSQNKKKQDKEAIKKMCGCFEVEFNFAETFKYSKDSTYVPSKNKTTGGLEWAQLVDDDKNKISIQHILLVGPESSPYIMKHWKQDWIYENRDFHMYNGDNTWKYETKEKESVKRQWTQKVYQVDDSPRYEGSSSWVHVDGKSYWENTTDAPLPRREYSQRNDYNITVRGNRQEITKDGWVHDQDNSKVIREEDKEDIVVAKEKGYNFYKKVDDSKCLAAASWWIENYSKWETVRSKWNEIYSRKSNLELHSKVDGKPLYSYLFDDAMVDKEIINKTIESFINKIK